MMRSVGAILLALALLSIPAATVAEVGAQHRSGPSDHGCSLYVSAPNPCDPESNN